MFNANTLSWSFFSLAELIESVMYLYRATGDSYLLEIGEDMLRSIQHSAKTSCGFATVRLEINRTGDDNESEL